MAFRDLALGMTQRGLRLLGDTGIVFYPVRADEIDAYTAAGSSGTDLEGKGLIQERPVVDDEGFIDVDNMQKVLVIDSDKAADLGVRQKRSSVTFDSTRYDIVRVLNDRLGQVSCYLEELAQ